MDSSTSASRPHAPRQRPAIKSYERALRARRPLAAAALLLVVCAGAALPASAQVVRPFTARFSTNDTGDVVLVGNTLMSCTQGNACTQGRTGSGSSLNNNDFKMGFVDVDSDSSTFNSSQATLTLPAGSTVLWAGLYWGADTTAGSNGDAAPNAAQNNLVRFAAPGSGYQTLTAAQINANTTLGNDYHAFADVTAQVRASRSGTYAVANVQAGTGVDRHAGWALVVAYRDPARPSRNLTVFDGFAAVSTANPVVTINVSGFVTPFAGPVNTHVGVVAYEGDFGSTGDQLQLNSTVLTDALNPSNNFFNSTVTRLGSSVTAKSPNYANQLGFDIDDVSANGVLPNGATSATITLRTATSGTAEFYYPGVVTFVTDLYAPVVKGNITKAVSDLNGGAVVPGDTLEYTVAVQNTGTDTAIILQMADPIPAGTAYVPGSLQVTAGANVGAKTDAPGDDQAEYDAVAGRVVFRLGAGATSSAGGSLASGQTTTATFRVQVNPEAFHASVVSNQAVISYRGATLGIDYADPSDGDPSAAGEQPTNVTVTAPPRVELIKSVSNNSPLPGADITYTVAFGNAAGARAATNLVIADKVPAGTEYKLGSHTYDAGTTGLPAPVVEYSTQPRDETSDYPPSPWLNYTPAGAPGTYDPAITYVRFRFTGTLNPNTSGAVSFTVRIP